MSDQLQDDQWEEIAKDSYEEYRAVLLNEYSINTDHWEEMEQSDQEGWIAASRCAFEEAQKLL